MGMPSLGRALTWCFTIAVCLAACVRPAAAQWASTGNGLCVLAGDQSYPATATDGAGGAFVVWVDSRSGTNADLYLQRVTASGALAAGWLTNGNTLCAAANDQSSPAIVADGTGGVFVTWVDDRAGVGTSDIYLQHITSTGAVAAGWPAGGLAICTTPEVQTKPALALESGAAIVVWQDGRNGTPDIYAQKVSAAGAIQWTADGAPVCAASGSQSEPTLAGDKAGGAIVAWQDTRVGVTANIYAQRLNASGAPQWAVDGITLCTSASDQLTPHVLPDGAGGAIVTWDDYRANNADVYAQRVNASGVAQWMANGVALVLDLAEQYGGVPITDGAGGAIVPWTDFRFASGSLYAQKISAAGALGWVANGLPICTVGDVSDPVASPDGTGGAFFVWDDARSSSTGVDIYAVRFTSGGILGSGWTSGGTLVCNAANNQLVPAVTLDGTGSLIASWFDGRSGDNDIYAKRLAMGGGAVDVPELPAGRLSLAAAPNPMTTTTTLRFSLAAQERGRLEVLDVTGRVVRVLLEEQDLAAGARAVSWDGRDRAGLLTPAGLYWARLVTTSGTEVRSLARLR
jgi:hypothetical protein